MTRSESTKTTVGSAAELGKLDATAQADLVRSGAVSPSELIDAAIERLETQNPSLDAVIHQSIDLARERAAAADLPAGPFRGVPFLLKDIGGAEAGQPCHGGMAALKAAGYTEKEDSYYVQRARAAGLITLGRTNTPELALLPTSEPEAYGPTRNPWNPAHSAGGSSGGAAAAVAAGIVPVAHASDGGGSIRGPASMCGLVGLKPSRGRCSFGPQLGERWSGLSCEFVVSRSVRDSAALLDAFAGAAPGDPYTAAPPDRPFRQAGAEPPGPLRIGFMDGAPRDLELHPDCRAAVRHTARLLEDLGHDVESAHPDALEDADAVANYVLIVSSNVARALVVAGEKIGRPIAAGDVEPLTWALGERGRSLSAPDLLAAIEYTHRFGRRLAAWWESGYDLLLTATQASPPPEIGYLTSTPDEPYRAFIRSGPYGVFTLPYNLSGQPAISLPLHHGESGLPIGSQLVAATGREDLLLKVATQLEEADPWRDRQPPGFARVA